MSDLESLPYADGETELTALVARPAGPARAGVLVFPTIMNPTESVIAKTKALADAGYLGLIADFYGRQPESFDEARQFAAEIRPDPSVYRTRLRAALKALAAMEDTQGLPLFAIGFCMGGQAVLELAREGAPFAGAVSFHGLLGTELAAEPGAIRTRLLILHGDADPMVPRSQVTAFWEEMDHAGADWHFHSYSGVKHGFTNPAPSENPATGYDSSADRQSWAAMHSFFDEILA